MSLLNLNLTTKQLKKKSICHTKEARHRAIDKELNSKIGSKPRTTKDVTSIVNKELAIFEVEGERRANLESCYENFNSIPSSSVKPERFFSGCGRTVTKIRPSLHDESVDKLSFLRGHLKTKNN
jgi:hypothetical protein